MGSAHTCCVENAVVPETHASVAQTARVAAAAAAAAVCVVVFAVAIQSGPPLAFDQSLMTPAKTRDVIALSFTRMFNEGPLVSLRGSPTVSPVTEFLCASLNSALFLSRS